jgi:site-specific recombinase, phage integrase family
VLPHLFRHTFARDWILAGGDEFTLQNLLGHTTSDMTKHYVNIYGKDLKNSQFYNLNPLDRRSTINSTITMKKGKK